MTQYLDERAPDGRAIEAFLQARSERPHWPGIPVGYRPGTEAEAYRMQAAIHDRLVAGGARLEGYKVGSTSAAGQAIYGLKEPVYAGIFDTTRSSTLAEALSKDLIAPSVECEIALILATDLDGASGELSLDDVADACSACHLACEVIDNRYGDPHAFGVPTLVADDFFHAGYVLGPAVSGWRGRSFADLDAEVVVDGTIHRGNSANVLKPLDSTLWLVRKLAGAGLRLRAGQVVLTGAIVPPVPVSAFPGELQLSVEGLGRMTMALLTDAPRTP